MTAPLNTDNEGETAAEHFIFEEWIRKNGFDDIKGLLTKHNMITPSTLNRTSPQFFKFISDPEISQKAHILPSLFVAIEKVSAVEIKPQIIRIFITKEEEEATKTLNNYHTKICELQNQIKQANDSLSANTKKCNESIRSSFTELINKIDTKQREIGNKLKDIEKEKQGQIRAKSDAINQELQSIQNALSLCASLQEDETLDKNKRKTKVVSIVDKIMNNELDQKISQFDTDISFDFNKKDIDSFIHNLSDVYASDKHPIPVIDKLQCKTNSTTAQIQFNASLSDEDKNRKISTALWIALESVDNEDEKTEQIQANLMEKFDQNKEEYIFLLKGLNINTFYTMQINFYQSKKQKNDMVKLLNYKPVKVQFRTCAFKIEKDFVYQADFDKNGICYALGSNFGQREWSNPYIQGLIKLQAPQWTNGEIKGVMGRTKQNCNTGGGGVDNKWLIVDFGDKVKIKPTHYTLKHDNNSGHYLRSWNFEGSNDGNSWTVLKQHRNDISLNDAYATHTWGIKCDEMYQMFRIYMVEKNTSTYWILVCCGFEIYGHFASM